MTKDYAKRAQKKPTPRKKRKKKKSYLRLWLFTIILIGLFIFTLISLSHHNKPEKSVTKIAIKTKVVKPKAAAAKVKQPQFDFYTLLPKEHVTINAKQNGPQYVLQVASVKDYDAADHLKAELALLGFDANINKQKQGNTTWYVISAGPYNSKQAALDDQKQLKLNKIKSSLHKIR